MKNFLLTIASVLCVVSFASCSAAGNDGDPAGPKVAGMVPADGSSGIDLNYAEVAITFSEAMNGTYSFNSNFPVGDVRWNNDNTTCYIISYSEFSSNTTYTFDLNPNGPGFASASGRALETTSTLSFTTGTTTNQPTVSSSSPASGATGVSAASGSTITVDFSQSMLSGYSFRLEKAIDGTQADVLSIQWLDSDTLQIEYDTLEGSTDYDLILNSNGSGQYFRNTDNIRLEFETTISFTTA